MPPNRSWGARCTHTGVGGKYRINGLHGTPEHEYLVEVTGGTVTLGIDAELEPGAEIAGTPTESGTHKPLARIAVSLLSPGSHALESSVETDSSGHYAFRGLAAGSHLVAFSYERSSADFDGFSTSFYNHVSSIDAASVLSPAPPQALTAIDGEVAKELARR